VLSVPQAIPSQIASEEDLVAGSSFKGAIMISILKIVAFFPPRIVAVNVARTKSEPKSA
jgi:hypothetical protein